MDLVIRGIAVYLFLLLIFRISGKRSLRNVTTFDFVLLLIIAETTQQALTRNDASLTGALLLIIVLVGTDILCRSRSAGRRGSTGCSRGSRS